MADSNWGPFLCALCISGLFLTVDSSSRFEAAHFAKRSLLNAQNHKYEENEIVPLYANKVGPFQNPR